MFIVGGSGGISTELLDLVTTFYGCKLKYWIFSTYKEFLTYKKWVFVGQHLVICSGGCFLIPLSSDLSFLCVHVKYRTSRLYIICLIDLVIKGPIFVTFF